MIKNPQRTRLLAIVQHDELAAIVCMAIAMYAPTVKGFTAADILIDSQKTEQRVDR